MTTLEHYPLYATPGAVGIRKSSLYERWYLVDDEGNTVDTLTKAQAEGVIADDDAAFAEA